MTLETQVKREADKFHTKESMVHENSVNAQQISERAVKRLKVTCAISFFAGFDAYIARSG